VFEGAVACSCAAGSFAGPSPRPLPASVAEKYGMGVFQVYRRERRENARVVLPLIGSIAQWA